jgi:hypothetical protein
MPLILPLAIPLDASPGPGRTECSAERNRKPTWTSAESIASPGPSTERRDSTSTIYPSGTYDTAAHATPALLEASSGIVTVTYPVAALNLDRSSENRRQKFSETGQELTGFLP